MRVPLRPCLRERQVWSRSFEQLHPELQRCLQTFGRGATVKEIYWTLGSRDIVAICEAPDDEAATVLSLSVASRGNVRSETLRAFSFDEMKKIVGKMV
jgi:uncharacterized protein with GYD domain